MPNPPESGSSGEHEMPNPPESGSSGEHEMPNPPESGSSGEREPGRQPEPSGSPEDALRRLEQRLHQASEAAERLMTQAAAEAASAGDPSKPPPAGWQTPEDGSRAGSPELDPFVALVQAMRELIPPELQRRLIAALREMLLALRALIDWYLERLDRHREESVEVQDIPIL
jgi:hypothetical protein